MASTFAQKYMNYNLVITVVYVFYCVAITSVRERGAIAM